MTTDYQNTHGTVTSLIHRMGRPHIEDLAREAAHGVDIKHELRATVDPDDPTCPSCRELLNAHDIDIETDGDEPVAWYSCPCCGAEGRL